MSAIQCRVKPQQTNEGVKAYNISKTIFSSIKSRQNTHHKRFYNF